MADQRDPPLARPVFTNFTPYKPGKPVEETERELGIPRAVKLASNENPIGPSPKAVAAITAALPSLNYYPDGGSFYLKQGLSRFYGLPEDHFFVGLGSNEIIELLIRTFVLDGENLVYCQKSFIIYKLCAISSEIQVIDTPMKNDKYDLEAMAAGINADTKMLFIANPNNPTGTYVTKEAFETFISKVPKKVIVVLDEAYFEYVTADDYPNGVDYLKKKTHAHLVVLRTFSKAYGLAGLRIGIGMASPEIIEMLNRARQPFNVTHLSQVGALAALDDKEHLERVVTLNSQERTRMTEELSRRGVTVVPSQGNFVLADFHRDGNDLFNQFLQKGVITRPMGGYGYPTSLRVSIGTPEDNDLLLKVWDELRG
eukprot:NODE_676_length_1275_cov_87.836237_g637_i0.p1 GENE.NODE_676_length_1275_cov_87.836237_g637_i0~~NODE_676_length_1275_cov_87.836237_g637_i0.p1  ORF type:complete len:370 (+),score=68.00 NODE_676_length_1275_cov_87.836237_g637_i0:72-1181(+)